MLLTTHLFAASLWWETQNIHVMATTGTDTPIIWKNGEAQRQYEYTMTLLRQRDLPPHLTVFLNNKLRQAVDDNEYDHSVFAGFGLGLLFMFGLSLIFLTSWTALGIYFTSLSLYHLLEYTYVWKFHPKDCGFNCMTPCQKHSHFQLSCSFLMSTITSLWVSAS